MNEDDIILQDWVEFRHNGWANKKELLYVNVRKSEISEVLQLSVSDEDNSANNEWSRIVMKNGRIYTVYAPYEKVMEMI